MSIIILIFLTLFITALPMAKPPIVISSFPKAFSLTPLWNDSSYFKLDSLSPIYPYKSTQAKQNHIDFHPLMALSGVNVKNDFGNVWQGGLWIEAQYSRLSAWVDARIYTLPTQFESRDGQFVDENSEDYNEKVSYSSFGRYVGIMDFETDYGSIAVGRDAQNWGPFRYSALTFNGRAIPYDQIYYDLKINSFRVRSLFGRLDIRNKTNKTGTTQKSRHVFGHRYTWNPNRDFQISISEQTIVYDQNTPQLFIPIFPLFIAKSYLVEKNNNGNIAMDLEWFIHKQKRIFAEFLIDDIESPISFFYKNLIQNKWALSLGFSNSLKVFNRELDVLVEAVHVEPFTYSHFEKKTAQAANGTMPIGLVEGPAYQRITLDLRTYFRFFLVEFRPSLERKGLENGAEWQDLTPSNHRVSKKYFEGSNWNLISLGKVQFFYENWFIFTSIEVEKHDINGELGFSWVL